MLATEFLNSNDATVNGSVLVLFGSERFFRAEILKRIPGASGEDADLSLSRFNGPDAEFLTVATDLKTVSMFGEQRVVLIEDAEEFVTANRSALEKLVTSSGRRSLLILDVDSWPKNTKLFKLVAQHGLAIECNKLEGASLLKWMQALAKDDYGKQLDRETASLILELAGDGLTLLQQEIGKLAALVGDASAITRDDVTKVVGGWKLETTWEMLDAVRDDRLSDAIQSLDKLMAAGDPPQKILGGLVYMFRKFAETAERMRPKSMTLPEALRASGVFTRREDADKGKDNVKSGEAYLKRLGFDKAIRILPLLVEADSDMKGGSRVDPRLLLERLFVRLAGHA